MLFYNKQFNVLILLVLISVVSCTTYVRGPIFKNTFWSRDHAPYVLDGDVIVHPHVTLQVESGVNVVFPIHTKLFIRGTLETAVNYTMWRRNTVFESDNECTKQRERKLPVYPGWLNVDHFLNKAVADFPVRVMSSDKNFVNGSLYVKGTICCGNLTKSDFDVIQKKFEELSGFAPYPGALKWKWQESFGSITFNITMPFQDDKYSYCGSIVIESDIADPKLHISKTDFLGLDTVFDGMSSNTNDINDIYVNDCLTAFTYSITHPFDVNCVRCMFRNVRNVFGSTYSNSRSTFSFSESTFTHSYLDLPRGITNISQSLFSSNSSLSVYNEANIFQNSFENCSVKINMRDYATTIQGNHFYDAFTGLIVVKGSMAFIQNNTFSGNKFGVIFVEKSSPIDYDELLSTINGNNMFIQLKRSDTPLQAANNIRYNTLKGNEYGAIIMDPERNLAMSYNNILANDVFNLVNFRRASLDASNSYWGTSDPTSISNKIWDARVDGKMGLVHYDPIRTSSI